MNVYTIKQELKLTQCFRHIVVLLLYGKRALDSLFWSQCGSIH